MGDDTGRAFRAAGYEAVGKKYGVPLFDLKRDKTRRVDTPLRPMDICCRALDADYLINLPVLKGHCQTAMTCALKNCKGCLPDREKRRFHAEGLMRPIAALAAACTLGKAALEDHQTYLTHLKTYALAAFQKAVPGLVVVAAGDAPHICAISLPGYPSQVVVRWLSDQGFCLSAGSACHRGQASHVYAAMGLSKPVRDGMLRVSFGPENTQEEVDRLAQALGTATQVLLPAGR